MFQQSLVGSGLSKRSPWSFAVSLLAQTMAICLVLLATMAYTPLLPAAGFAVWLEAPPPPPGAPPPPPEQVAVVQEPPRYEAELTQPPRIPDDVLRIADPEEAPRIEPQQQGVRGSEGPGGEGSVIASIVRSVPKPVERPKPKPKVEPPPPAPPSGPIVVSTSIQAAKIVRRVQPVYPANARAAGISGKVRLRAIISGDDVIEQLSVLSGHPFLIPAAVQAVKQWRYRPTILNGVPTQVATEIDVNFVLR